MAATCACPQGCDEQPCDGRLCAWCASGDHRVHEHANPHGPTVAPFDHDPARTDHQRPDDLPNGNRFPCYACWCYACGARTDGPRNEYDGDAHPGDPDHRWCYE